MSQHLPDAVLQRFVGGTCDEAEAVRAATHIDDCAICAGRAARAEFVGRILDAAPVPRMPADLVSRVLIEADRPEPAPVAEVAIGVGLLLLALVLMGAGEDPVRIAVNATRLWHAAERWAHAADVFTIVGWSGAVALLGGLLLLVRGRGLADPPGSHMEAS